VSSRERAHSLILAGKVRAGDVVIDKPGRLVTEDIALNIQADSNPYVGRGGLKLAHGLQTFDVDPTGKVAVDIGASTGGFTDCLLQHGARKVFAVDVGYGQLDWKLQSDQRVTIVDRKNARHLALADIEGEPVDLAVIDVAFISLKLILPPTMAVLQPAGEIVALVKPQFEVGREEVENKGVIRDRKKHLKVLLELHAFVAEQGWVLAGLTPSPITGQKGNREYLIHCREKTHGTALDASLIPERIEG